MFRSKIKDLACMVFSMLMGILQGGKIIPDKTLPIQMSTTNALRNAEYIFTMKLETSTIPGCFIEILFPDQQYIDGIGLDYGFIVNSPANKVVPGTISGKKLSVEVGYTVQMTSIQILVKGVLNPSKVGGTGLFKAYYTCSNNIIDVCEDFGTVAVTDPSFRLQSSQAKVEEGSSMIAGETSNYLINLKPQFDLNKNVVFKITFPDYYNFQYLKDLVGDFPSENPCEVVPDPTTGFKISGNITCEFSETKNNVITWVGNDMKISKSSMIWLRLKNVLNPEREMTTDFIAAEINLKNSFLTYEYDDAVDGLRIVPGPVADFRVTPALQLPLVKLTFYDFFISFTPTNALSSFRVVTRFRAITSCVIKNGIFPLAINVPVACTINSNVLEVNGIQKYLRKYKANADKIILKVYAKTPMDDGIQIPFELYTYQNSDFTVKVDEDVTSTKTILSITPARNPPYKPQRHFKASPR
jgi:hypothetical protein